MSSEYNISTSALEAMASNGNQIARLALTQRKELARITHGHIDLERQARDLTVEIARLKRRIAELESLGAGAA